MSTKEKSFKLTVINGAGQLKEMNFEEQFETFQKLETEIKDYLKEYSSKLNKEK